MKHNKIICVVERINDRQFFFKSFSSYLLLFFTHPSEFVIKFFKYKIMKIILMRRKLFWNINCWHNISMVKTIVNIIINHISNMRCLINTLLDYSFKHPISEILKNILLILQMTSNIRFSCFSTFTNRNKNRMCINLICT